MRESFSKNNNIRRYTCCFITFSIQIYFEVGYYFRFPCHSFWIILYFSYKLLGFQNNFVFPCVVGTGLGLTLRETRHSYPPSNMDKSVCNFTSRHPTSPHGVTCRLRNKVRPTCILLRCKDLSPHTPYSITLKL